MSYSKYICIRCDRPRQSSNPDADRIGTTCPACAMDIAEGKPAPEPKKRR